MLTLVKQLVETAFEGATSESRLLEEAAMILRRHIISGQQNSTEVPWPPSANYLQSDATSTPEPLCTFVVKVLTGQKRAKSSSKSERLRQSISEDICSATTYGGWKMPKHLLLAMTLRHLTGSAEIITLVNRYGHCQSYSQVL